MSDKTLIYGKDAWPYTRAAREAYAREGRQFDYYNVIQEPDHLETMLQYSKGARKVPVIVEGENVTIGFEGKAWGLWSFGWRPDAKIGARLRAQGVRQKNSVWILNAGCWILDTGYWMLWLLDAGYWMPVGG